MAKYAAGMLAVLVVVMGAAAAIGLGYMANAHGEEVEVLGYEQVSDLTGLFETSSDPMFVQYDPAENKTGYTEWGSTFFSGVEYKTLASNRYNGFPLSAIKAEQAISITLTTSMEQAYDYEDGIANPPSIVGVGGSPDIELSEWYSGLGTFVGRSLGANGSSTSMAIDPYGVTIATALADYVGTYQYFVLQTSGLYLSGISEASYDGTYPYTYNYHFSTGSTTYSRSNGTASIYTVSPAYIEVDMTDETLRAYDSSGSLIGRGSTTTIIYYGTGQIGPDAYTLDLGQTLAGTAYVVGDVTYLDPDYGVRIDSGSDLTIWSSGYAATDLTMAFEAPKDNFSMKLGIGNEAQDGATLMYIPLYDSETSEGYGHTTWTPVQDDDGGQLCIAIKWTWLDGTTWFQVGTASMTAGSGSTKPTWTDNDDWLAVNLGAFTHYQLDIHIDRGTIEVTPITSWTSFTSYTLATNSSTESAQLWEEGHAATEIYYPPVAPGAVA